MPEKDLNSCKLQHKCKICNLVTQNVQFSQCKTDCIFCKKNAKYLTDVTHPVLIVRTPDSQKYEAVLRRARTQGSKRYVSFNSRLESRKEEEDSPRPDPASRVRDFVRNFRLCLAWWRRRKVSTVENYNVNARHAIYSRKICNCFNAKQIQSNAKYRIEVSHPLRSSF